MYNHKMKKNKYHTAGTILKLNIKTVERDKIDTPNTQIHYCSLFWIDNGVHPPTFPTGGTCALSVIRFQDGGRRSAVEAEWSVPKLENDLLRRNATTNG